MKLPIIRDLTDYEVRVAEKYNVPAGHVALARAKNIIEALAEALEPIAQIVIDEDQSDRECGGDVSTATVRRARAALALAKGDVMDDSNAVVYCTYERCADAVVPCPRCTAIIVGRDEDEDETITYAELERRRSE